MLKRLFLLLIFSASIAHANDQNSISEADGYTPVSPSLLEIQRQVSPQFPRRAIRDGHTHEECVAQLFVDEDGKVEDVQVQMGCPEVFHPAVVKAARKWRFAPHIGDDDAPVPVTFALRFRFQRQS